MKEEIKKAVKQALNSLEKKGIFFRSPFDDILIEQPKENFWGDYTTNIAMVLAKKNKQNPEEMAILMKKEIEENIKKK